MALEEEKLGFLLNSQVIDAGLEVVKVSTPPPSRFDLSVEE